MRKKRGPKNEHLKRKKPAWLLILTGLTLVALLAAVSCGGTGGERRAEEPAQDEPQAATNEEQGAAEKSQLDTEEPQAGADLEHPSLGDENAPVVLIEYADYQ